MCYFSTLQCYNYVAYKKNKSYSRQDHPSNQTYSILTIIPNPSWHHICIYARQASTGILTAIVKLSNIEATCKSITMADSLQK